jgi:hypothetical protein
MISALALHKNSAFEIHKFMLEKKNGFGTINGARCDCMSF